MQSISIKIILNIWNEHKNNFNATAINYFNANSNALKLF